ncbi:MAG: glycosyltransferase [Shewanella sp.]
MNVTKISIVTLTYKNWRLLDKAIASVANQKIDAKYQVEYLVVDDGTEDFDVEFVEGILSKSGLNYRIIVNSCNLGTVASFNNAIIQSTGMFIFPLSADDEFFDENVVNEIVNEFISTGADVVTALRVPVRNGIAERSLPKSKEWALFDSPNKLLKRILIHGNIISGASTYYSRRVFDSLGFFDPRYRLLEDYPFYIKLLSAGLDIRLFKRNVIKYGVEGLTGAGPMNPILKQDFDNLYRIIATRTDLNILERRFIEYSKLMTKEEKYKNSWKYPEKIIIKPLLKIMHKFC